MSTIQESQSQIPKRGQKKFTDKNAPRIYCQNISNNHVGRTPAPRKRAFSPVSVTENLEQVQRPKPNNNDDDGHYNYVSDDEEEDKPHHVVQRSKCVLQKLRDNKRDGLHGIAVLAAEETAPISSMLYWSMISCGIILIDIRINSRAFHWRALVKIGHVHLEILGSRSRQDQVPKTFDGWKIHRRRTAVNQNCESVAVHGYSQTIILKFVWFVCHDNACVRDVFASINWNL